MRTILAITIVGFVLFGTLAAQEATPPAEQGVGTKIGESVDRGLNQLGEKLRRGWADIRKSVDELTVQGRVYGRLRWDKSLATAPIEITVQNENVVTLSGSVSDEAAHNTAVKLAQDTIGVGKVVDNLTVSSTTIGTAPAKTTDHPAGGSNRPAAHSAKAVELGRATKIETRVSVAAHAMVTIAVPISRFSILAPHSFMPSLRKPSPALLRRIIAERSPLDFTYAHVGATSSLPPSPLHLPPSFTTDHTRVELGKGATTFERAKAALGRWQQFDLGWLEAFPGDTPIRAGETVLVIARAGGLWWTNAARIVYTIDNHSNVVSRFGFAYGTLPGHVESGEERFLIEWERETDVVHFDILAFSRPRHFLVRLNRRRARAMQKRFSAEAAAAMLSAVQ